MPLAITPTFSPWTHTSDGSYIYQLSLVFSDSYCIFTSIRRCPQLSPRGSNRRIPALRWNSVWLCSTLLRHEKIYPYCTDVKSSACAAAHVQGGMSASCAAVAVRRAAQLYSSTVYTHTNTHKIKRCSLSYFASSFFFFFHARIS